MGCRRRGLRVGTAFNIASDGRASDNEAQRRQASGKQLTKSTHN